MTDQITTSEGGYERHDALKRSRIRAKSAAARRVREAERRQYEMHEALRSTMEPWSRYRKD